MLNHIRPTTVLMLSELFLLLVFLTSSLLSVVYLNRSAASLKNLDHEVSVTLGVTDTTNWMRAARTTLLAALPHLADRDLQAFNDVLKQAKFYYDGGKRYMHAYQAAPKLPGEVVVAEELSARYKDYTDQGVGALFTAMQKGDVAGFLLLAGTTVVTFDEAYRVPLDKVIAIHKQLSVEITRQAANDTYITYAAVNVSLVLLILASVTLGIVLKNVLIKPLHRAGEITAAIGRGDLTPEFISVRKDEMGLLLQGLEKMQSGLTTMVRMILSGVSEVARVTAQIGDGNRRLSSRTEQQAAALEETSSSMEELSCIVMLNAGNAAAASGTAYECGAAMRDVYALWQI